jgi:hypothetical protein
MHEGELPMGLKEMLGNDSGETDEEFPGNDAVEDGDDGIDPKPKRPEAKDRPKPAPVRVTPSVRAEIREKLTAMIEFFALGLQLRDPYCGEVLEDEAGNVVDRMVVIICKRPKWVAWFTSGSDYGDWLMLATTLQPIVIAWWQHHIAHDIKPVNPAAAAAPDDLEQYAAPPAA